MKKNKVRLAGITLFTEDAVPIDHARYDKGVRRRVRRFTKFQRAMLIAPSASAGVLAGRLVALDLVPADELLIVLAQSPYRLSGAGCIEWTTDGTLDRRTLSALTILSLARDHSPPTELESLKLLLAANPDYKGPKALLELELDRIAWAAQFLPKSLWSHLAGVRRFTLLSREDLANDHPELVPAAQLSQDDVDREAKIATWIEDAIGADHHHQTMPAVVRLATEVFTIQSSKPVEKVLETWSANLMGLSPHVEAADIASAVIVAWNLRLVTAGTSTEPDAKLATRAGYARVANKPLWGMLSKLPSDPAAWDPDELQVGLESLMSEAPEKDRKRLGAAIASFVLFLADDFGLSVQTRGLHKLIPEVKPRAKWISPHAIARGLRWLDDRTEGDRRLLEICALMIDLASQGGFRLRELRWLRVANVSFLEGGGLEIEVVPLAGQNELKTEAAERRTPITDPATCARVRAWVDKRIKEGAPNSALMFGDVKDEDGLYRPYNVHALLLQVLKRATGDPRLTFHSLRHTVITNWLTRTLSTHRVGSINRHSLMAAAVGHVVATTSFEWYAHRIEDAVRLHIDTELHRFELTNAEGQLLLNIPANTLTQQARRQDVTLTDQVWSRARGQSGELIAKLPDGAASMTLVEPTPPSLKAPVTRTFTATRCLHALDLLSQEKDPHRCEILLGLTPPQQELLTQAAVEAAAAVYAKRGLLLPTGCSTVTKVLAQLDLDIRRADQPRYAKLVDWLSLPQDPIVVQAAAKAWTKAWRSGRLNADPPEGLVPILKLLHAAGVTAGELLLRVRRSHAEADLLARSDAVALSTFNAQIPHSPLKAKSNESMEAHLLWPSAEGTGSAGESNAGLDALMFAAAVWSNPKLSTWRMA